MVADKSLSHQQVVADKWWQRKAGKKARLKPQVQQPRILEVRCMEELLGIDLLLAFI